ncbi:hypothetical protein OIU85_007695 [Salix viminalis]|uniref:Uncharacterized protein n=1 Tax=Salix viminalis TaxID=40686 RepID=A0A9Q0P9C2_SALVM|nr:hypothetical protein OIU85_007695 [Salix viminalis]
MRPNLSVEFLCRLSLTILLVSAITSTSTAAVLKRNSSPIFNATIGEGNEEEFSMDSEVHQRLIASQSQFIGYRSLEKQPFCNYFLHVEQTDPPMLQTGCCSKLL